MPVPTMTSPNANLSTDTVVAIFAIFGIPLGGSAFAVYNVVTIFGPFGQPYDCAALVTQLNGILALLVAEQCTVVTALVQEWGPIRTSPMDLQEAAGTKGMVISHKVQRENIRELLGDTIGFQLAGRTGFTQTIQAHNRGDVSSGSFGR